jgi:hypothetical protein
MSANLGFTSPAPAANLGFRNRLSNVSNTAASAGSSVWSFFSSNLFYAGLVVFFLAAIYFYWHYIGYEINSSYTSLVDLIRKRQEGSVGLNLWGDEKPEIGATATLPNQPPTEAPMSKSDLPAGIPGSRDAPAVSASDLRDSLMPIRAEVFNVSRNIYTYEDALPVCKALGAELATFEQVQEAHKQGADWCNYGWVKGQMAVFPTQKETWDKLQHGPEQYRNACGKPGINGGNFDNPDLRFGVNCYGLRPDKKATDELLSENGAALPATPEEIDFDRKVQKFRDQLDTMVVLPWNKSKWST